MNVLKHKLKFIGTEIWESLVLALGYSVPIVIVLFVVNLGVVYWPVNFLIYVILFVLILTLKMRKNSRV